ncbi:type IX secretion system outer membrane channel protein PorV [Compostibacter hankyongensis]|uniref:Type IX secretion system outer membrane channel protein PorV n=1 Tax=Compostibacter hankyongensis TaxID=1007089 RepID=A0ABP8G8Q0_9BACT
MKKIFVILLGSAGLLSVTAGAVRAQMTYGAVDGRVNTVNTAVPFLRIVPDARSGAMGDAGLALSADATAVFHNLAKLPFAEKGAGATVTYTPWLREMADDVFLAAIGGYRKLDERQAIGASLRYFDMGDIQLTDFEGTDLARSHPREFAVDAGYALKLDDGFSMGIALRYIHSRLANGGKADGSSYKAGTAVAGDISAFYTKNVSYGGKQGGIWSFGAAITNLGSRISYTQDSGDKDFLPANLGIGAAYTHLIDERNKITLTLDINKLMAPTPDTADADRNNIPDYREKGTVGALFSSFGDAPGGIKEELHELMYSVGAEYWYNSLFAIRAGYFNEHRTKGNRKFLSLGIGLKYDRFGLDFSYLVPSGSGVQQNPLSNTLRLSLQADLDGLGK